MRLDARASDPHFALLQSQAPSRIADWKPALRVALAALTTAAAVAHAKPAPPAPDMALGDPKAPVTVIEYASVGCSHCAVWATTVYPAFKAKYIATGKARFVLHEMLTGYPTVAAAGFLTARCASPKKYFQVVDAVFARQEDIYKEAGVGILKGIAKDAGVNEVRFTACLKDEAALKALDDRTQADAAKHGVTGTPTFFVNGKKLDGEQSLAELDAAIADARRH